MTAGLGPLDQVSLFCRDIERSTRFYGEVLGLPHLGTYGDLVFFDLWGVRLYLHRTDERDWRPGSVLYLRADDIRAQVAAFAASGIAFSEEPHLVHRDERTGEETWMAFFEDPDGNTLALSSRVSRREEP
jgi:catechol 2,3-dioxygenase-like lactoylglutathione lyase family enzyme